MKKMLVEFSSLITVNETGISNLITFPNSSLEDFTASITEGYIVLMPIPETDWQCPKRNKFISEI